MRSCGGAARLWRGALQVPLGCAVLVALVLASALARPERAGAYLYWGHGNKGEKGGIARADLNGGGVDPGFISDTLGADSDGIAVSSRYVYFDGFLGAVQRASLDGGDLDPDLFTTPQPPPCGIELIEAPVGSLVLAGDHIYWSYQGAELPCSPNSEYGIGRANVDGGEVEPFFIRTASPVKRLAVHGGRIYWASEHAIGRADLDGREVVPDLIGLAGDANGLAVAGGHVYWSVTGGHAIARASIDGRAVAQSFITGLRFVSDVTAVDGHLYWEATETLTAESLVSLDRIWIGRARLDGSDVQRTLIKAAKTLVEEPGQLAGDSLGPGGAGEQRHKKQRPAKS
jgi:hypothetical protein